MTRRAGSRVQRRASGDKGSATVLAVGVIAVLLALGAVALLYAQAAVARQRAATAADLAALAAAARPLAAPADRCADAARVARANGARLVACDATSADASVAVTLRLRGPLAAFGDVTARAGAGRRPLGPSATERVRPP